MAAYPPYQQPLLDFKTRLVTTPWQLFFLTLAGGSGDGGTITPGTITLDKLQAITAPRLLGRGTPGLGPVEQISLGTGLALTGTVLSVTAGGTAGVDAVGYWTPITNGDPLSPEILFDSDGACLVGFVPTPGGA